MVRVSVGEVLPSDRPVVVSDFDVVLTIEFANRKALQAYLASPAHQAATETVLKPLVKKVQIFDAVNR